MKMHPLPEIGTAAQILLLCSRERLSEVQADRIVELCAEIGDWDDFLKQASFRMVVPFVNRHLRALQPAAIPHGVLETLHARTRNIALRNLTMMAVQNRLVRDVLDPLDAPYLFFKGPTLAHRYYRDPVLRMYRDLDLLTRRCDMPRLGRRLRELGYTAHPDPLWGSEDAVHFRQRFKGMMDWLSPEGILIEMPTTLDAEWDRLPTDELLAQATTVKVGDLDIPIMPDADFLAYMCRHHCRHHWARLHWIADLNVISDTEWARHPLTMDRARRRGLGRTLAAAFEIDHAASEPYPWKAEFDDPFAHEVFRHMLMNLNGDQATEMRLRDEFTTTDIDIAQPRRWWSRASRNLSGRFRPAMDDFEHYPLPRQRQGLYYLLRPVLWVRRKLLLNRGTPNRTGQGDT